MRNFLTLSQQLFEAELPNEEELASIKDAVAHKIKELPLDVPTAKALEEIEDLLAHMHVKGRKGSVGDDLLQVNDPTVTAAQKMLARYILSIDMTVEQRTELFSLWKADKLVDTAKLLKKGKKYLSEIITSYDSNPAIRELTDEVMGVQFLGQGKGEFGLSVLSKSISKAEKGDLLIDGRKIEVKTADGGAGRFTDQEVRPGRGFEKAANELNEYVTKHPTTPFALPASGLAITKAVKIAPLMEKPKEFIDKCKNVINLIFDHTDEAAVNRIGEAMLAGNWGAAMQEYAKLSFNFYMDKKEDEGVLYINLAKDPVVLIYFTDANELITSGLRLHASTVYITSVKDIRLPYPQMEIIDTTQGGIKVDDEASTVAAMTAKRAEKRANKISDVAARTPMQDLRPNIVDRAKRKVPEPDVRQKR